MTSSPEALLFLKKNNIGTLSTVSEEGMPCGATILYTVNNAGEICFATRSKTQKYQNILQNQNIALTVTNTEMMKTMQIKGTVSPISTMEESMQIMKKMTDVQASLNSWIPPVSKLTNGEFVLMKIIPHWMRWGDFSHSSGKNESECFEEILNKT